MKTCTYCATRNPDDKDHCIACGAPLEMIQSKPIQVEKIKIPKVDESFGPANQFSKELQDARKIGDQTEKVLYAYALVWRTLAEAAAIAIVAFGIGIVGGATGMAFWGVLGAVIVGAAVGFTIKMSYITLFSAPIGMVIGTVIGVVFAFLGTGPKVFVFTTTIFAVIAAILGGRGAPYPHRNWYEKLRPFLGGIGGLLFGVLGMLLGAGLKAGVEQLMRLF